MKTVASFTFKGFLDFMATLNNPKWHVVLQASQFDPRDFKTSVQPVTGLLTLNIGPQATRAMVLHDTHFEFCTKRQGIEQFMQIPYTAVMEFINPVNQEFMHFPFFLDHGDVEPEDLEYSDTMIDTRKQTTLDSLLNKSLNLDQSSNGFQLGNVFIPTLFNFPKEPAVVPQISTLEKAGLRNWVVIEGGRNKPEVSPVIDEIHRAKEERRARQANLWTQDELDSKVAVKSDLRSDGVSGDKSTYFPDLDVSKCYFQSKRVDRPTWLAVVQGGKA